MATVLPTSSVDVSRSLDVSQSIEFRKEFFFRRRNGKLDWRKLVNVNLERVVREVDVDTLQDNVEHITFADIVEDDLRHFTDANFIQLFRMCQLIIEYLLNVQNYLVGVSGQRNSQVEKFLLELQKHKAINQKKDERIKLLKHEVKSLKRELRAYERTAGRKATIVEASEKTGKFSCVMCRSHFYKEKYLAKHYAKRHPDYNSSTGAAEPKQALVSQSVVMEKIMSTLKTENNTQFELLTARLGDLERTLSEKDDLLRQQTMMLERGNEEKEGRKVHPIVTQLYDADEEAKYNVNRDDRDAKLKQELQEQQSQMFNDLTQYVSRLESELREIKETKIVQTVEIEEEEEEQEEEEEGEEESWHARTESTLSLAEQDRVRKELANHPYAYVPFPELPFLKSRYQHAHESIKSSFNSFQVISEKMEKKGYNALSHDLVHSGYAPSIAKVEQDIAFLMDKYYEVPAELEEALDKVEEQGCLSRTMDVLDQQAEADRRCVDQLKPALQLQRGSTESFSSTSVANIDAAPSLSSAGQPSTSISTANTHPHSSVGDKNYSHVTSRTAGDVDYHHDADGTEEEELQLDREEAALQAELQRVLQDSAKKKARIPNIRHNNQADIGDALSRGYHNTKNKTMGDDASIPGPARTQQNTLSTVSSSPTATASMSAPPPHRPLSRPSSLDIVSPTLSDAPSLPPSVSPVQRLSPANTDRSCPPLPVPSSRPTPSPRSRAFSPAVPSPSPSRANTVTSMNQSTPSHTGRLNTRHDTSDNSPSVPPRRGRKDDNTFSSPVHNDINNKDYIKSMRSGDNKQGQYNVTSGSNGKLMGHDTVFDSVKRVGSNNHDIKMKGFPSMSAIDEKEEKGGVQSANTSTPVKSMSEGSNAASYGGNIDDTSDINDKIEEVKPVDVDNGIMSFHLDDDGEEDSTQPVASGWLASGKSNSIKTKGPRNNQWSTGNTAANNNSNDSNYNNNSKGISTNSRMSGVRSAQSSSASSAIVVSLNDTLESIGIADFSDTDDQHEYYGSNKNNCSTNIASHANNRPSSTATSTFMTLASTSSSVESADIKQLKSSDTWGLRSAEAAIESFDANDDVDSILHNNSNVIQSIDEEDFKTVKDFGSSSRSNLEHNTANSTVKKNIDRGSVWSKKKQGGSVRSVSNKHNSMGSSSNFMSSTDNNYKNENESNGARVPRRTSINAFGSDDLSSGVQRNKFTASSVSSLSSRGDAKKESTVISMFGLEDLDDDDDIDYIGGSSARSGSSSGAQGVGSFNKAPSGNVRSPSVCNKGSGMKFIDEDDLVEESFDDFDY